MNYTNRDVIGIVLIVITALLLGYCIVMSNANTPIALPSSVESTDTERFAVELTDIEVSNVAAYIFSLTRRPGWSTSIPRLAIITVGHP